MKGLVYISRYDLVNNVHWDGYVASNDEGENDSSLQEKILEQIPEQFNELIINVSEAGNANSGHRGHRGIPGQRGGSLPASGGGAAMGLGAEPTGQDLTKQIGKALLSIPTDKTPQYYLHEQGISFEVPFAMALGWTITSNDSRLDSLYVHQFAEQEIPGVHALDWQNNRFQEVLSKDSAPKEGRDIQAGNYIVGHEAEARRAVGLIYKHTQEVLTKAGMKDDDYVTLYRGVREVGKRVGEPGESVSYTGNAVESWTLSKKHAEYYVNEWNPVGAKEKPLVGQLITAKVPKKAIFTGPYAGWGARDQDEVLVLNNIPLQVTVLQ